VTLYPYGPGSLFTVGRHRRQPGWDNLWWRVRLLFSLWVLLGSLGLLAVDFVING
jgi:hypothetical protein